MAYPQHYQLNIPFVTSEVIDGEVVIIHLDSGNYYSMQGVGEHIWSHLLNGVSTDGITSDLVRYYGCDEATASSAVARLVRELIAEGLIVPGAATVSVLGAATESVANVAVFAEPVLTKYTDMQNLLMVDPIHEVTDEGWPMRPNDPGQAGVGGV